MLYNVIITYEYNVIIKVTILKSYFETFMFGETIFWHLFPLPYNLIVAIFRRDQLWNPYYWENRIALQKEVVGGGGLNTHTLDRQESILATWLPWLPACIVMHVVISCQIYLFIYERLGDGGGRGGEEPIEAVDSPVGRELKYTFPHGKEMLSSGCDRFESICDHNSF